LSNFLVVPPGMCCLLGASNWLGLQFSSKVLLYLSIFLLFEFLFLQFFLLLLQSFMQFPCFFSLSFCVTTMAALAVDWDSWRELLNI
jgi:hypothetical protein